MVQCIITPADVTQRTASTRESFLPTAGAGRRFALLWLVVALLVQGFATQTHGHFGIDRASAVAASVRVAAIADDQKNVPAKPACPLCEERALFGAYLLGGSVTVAAPLAAAYDPVAVSLPLLALRASSHAWRSRAPPVLTI